VTQVEIRTANGRPVDLWPREASAAAQTLPRFAINASANRAHQQQQQQQQQQHRPPIGLLETNEDEPMEVECSARDG